MEMSNTNSPNGVAVDTSRREAILEQLKTGVIEYDTDRVVEAANESVELGLDAYEMVMQGLAAGMGVVGEYFDCGDYFVPEVLLCSEALYAGLDILRHEVGVVGEYFDRLSIGCLSAFGSSCSAITSGFSDRKSTRLTPVTR